MKELSTAIQHQAPIKIFVLSDEHPGMAREWEQQPDGNGRLRSYSASLPDFTKLAEAYGAVGLRCERPSELDARIEEMIDADRPVLLHCRVARLADGHPR